MSKFSIQFVLFEQFLKEHKLSYESLLFLLAEHFDHEGSSITKKTGWRGKRMPHQLWNVRRLKLKDQLASKNVRLQ